MNFQQFRSAFFETLVFTTNQVYAWQPGFDKNNLGRWVRKGYLVKLRNGYYSFPEYLGKADLALYIANRIYRPSYISLHSTLAFYGIIPESVVQVTSVTTLKTMALINPFGTYSYQTVNEALMFGYDIKPVEKGLTLMIANPEKALIDLLYLYPFYNRPEDFKDLRLDEEFMTEQINAGLMREYAARINRRALMERTGVLLKTYGL